MGKITLSRDHHNFCKDGEIFFLMSDTCWSAFTNITTDEWEHYLKTRKAQGFNAIQMNILPQWDRGIGEKECICPFLETNKPQLDFKDIPDSYFDHIEKYLEILKSYDMIPILVLLWSNYVKGTFFDYLWGRITLNKNDVTTYTTYVAKRFKKFDPMYFVCGDTSFSDEAVNDYYLPALKALKAADADALASLHICGDGFTTKNEIEETIPASLLYSELLDFYVYQSGHFEGWLKRSYDCAVAFRSLKIKKPVFNSEPCYEGWDIPNGVHESSHIRRSTWFSILGGADAGLSYGAQGIWQWYREGDFFAPYHISDEPLLYKCERPFFAKDALTFEGVNDRTFARQIMEQYHIVNVKPDERFKAPSTYTKLATANDGKVLLLYIPKTQLTQVYICPEGFQFDLYDLAKRAKIEIDIDKHESSFTVPHVSTTNDCLLVAYLREE